MTIAHAKILDIALNCFSTGFISNESYYLQKLPFDDEVVDFLLSDGSLKRDAYGIKITYKGRLRIDGNGFVREHRIKIGTYVASVVAAVASVITVITYLIDKIYSV